MSEFERLKERLQRGYISRRSFVRNAVALGVTASVAITFARQSKAQGISHFEEAKAGFPVLRRASLSHESLNGKTWDKDDPQDMFNYTVALLNKARADAQTAGNTHHLEDAWLAYACSLAQSESWEFDSGKNPVQHGWQTAAPTTPTKLDTEATALATGAVVALNGNDNEDEAQARWALAIVHMNFGRVTRKDPGGGGGNNAVSEYRKILRRKLDEKIPNAEQDSFKFEVSDAYVHAGQVNEAMKLLGRRAGRDPVKPDKDTDWHWHQLAWCYFVKAGRFSSDAMKLGYYDLALGFLRGRKSRPEDVGHLALGDLLTIACYGAKAIVYDRIGQLEAQDLMEMRAERHWVRFRKKFRQGVTDPEDHPNFQKWTIKQAKQYATFSDTADANNDRKHWDHALNKAKIG